MPIKIQMCFYCLFHKKVYICGTGSNKGFAIVSWCNGSTTDSGPVCQGSNPCETTRMIDELSPFKGDSFFICFDRTFLG